MAERLSYHEIEIPDDDERTSITIGDIHFHSDRATVSSRDWAGPGRPGPLPDDEGRVVVFTEIRFTEDGEQLVDSVRFEALNGQRVLESDLRDFSLQGARQAVLNSPLVVAVSEVERDGSPVLMRDGTAGGQDRKRQEARKMMGKRKRRRMTDDFLGEVAEVYRAAEPTGAPTAAVAEACYGSHSSAARWVGEARRRGLLPPVERGVDR